MNITIDGMSVSFLKEFAESFQEAYEQKAQKQSRKVWKALPFGKFNYNLQIQYGKEKGAGFFFTPVKNIISEQKVEYLIAEELLLIVKGQEHEMVDDKIARLIYPDGSTLLYSSRNDSESLTKEFAQKTANEFFEGDLKVAQGEGSSEEKAPNKLKSR